MRLRGFAIPGLAIAASEMPTIDGVVALDNPEIGEGIALDRNYTLEEVAELHVRTIEDMGRSVEPLDLYGMSMGGMILAIVASHFRKRLPARCRFHFFVTTPNSQEVPAIPTPLLDQWTSARRGVVGDYERVLAPFFAPSFLATAPAAARAYYEYRASGGNRQSGRAFFRQVNALRSCPAHRYFAALDGNEASFIGGADDLILGPTHSRALKLLCPGAKHREIDSLGHMVNIERPDLIRAAFDAP